MYVCVCVRDGMHSTNIKINETINRCELSEKAKREMDEYDYFVEILRDLQYKNAIHNLYILKIK